MSSSNLATTPPTSPAILPAEAAPHLSKTRYLAGRRCRLELWLRAHRPELATPPDAGLAARFAAGHAVGSLAHGLHPGGVLVAEGPEAFDAALARTRALLADPSVPALFEAAFEHAGVRVRADLLVRAPDGAWRLGEVKGVSRPKAIHLDDLAIQCFVLEGAGLRIAQAELVHVNPAYVRRGERIDPNAYFSRVDLTAEVRERLPGLASEVAALHGLLAGQAPQEAPGPRCKAAPGTCAFWAHCTAGLGEDWVGYLPRLNANGAERLAALGVQRIGELPDSEDVPLPAPWRRARDVARGRAPIAGPGLADALPAPHARGLYLDFEVAAPGIPLLPGTRPWENLPFQWSLHERDARGHVRHLGFLADGRGDPRREFTESLLAVAGARPGLPIYVWTEYESRILREMEAQFPELARGLERLRGRLVDLHRITRRHVHHPGFLGSTSLKRVAPVLVPGFAWPDAAAGVAEGASAAASFEALLAEPSGSPGRNAVLRALWEYCRSDTWALVRVHEALAALGAEGGAAP